MLVGGGGERKMLRLVARYGDASNIIAVSPETVAHKLAVLDRHCEAPATVRRTILSVHPVAEASTFLSEMRTYADLGVDEATVVPSGGRPDEWVERVVAPLVGPLTDLG